ncbi:MAG: hypothetical protein ACKVT0_04965, partial [Planctomycetaceae bacterium]
AVKKRKEDQTQVSAALFTPPAPQKSVSNPTRIVDIAFNVMYVDFSHASAGDGRKIWNHIDELRMKPEQVRLLSRNGLRVGAASPASWAAIQAVLDSSDAKITSDQLFPQRGFALPIHAGAVDEGTSIFCYQADGRLIGKSFPGGEKTIMIDYAVRPELDGSTELGISFEINRESADMVWQQVDGVMRQAPERDHHRFDDLSTFLTLQQGEFLVLGPRDDIRNDSLVGTQFLSSPTGPGSIRLIFLAPIPYQTQTVARPPS